MSAADPDTLVGLLAEEARLRVVAALVLGARDDQQVVAATGLELKAVHVALDRLTRGGLVEAGPGGLRLRSELFSEAARRVASTRREHQVSPDALGATVEQAEVLRNVMVDGRLHTIPSTRSKRLVVLDFLAGKFEPGRVYPEREVNSVLSAYHPDYAALRRYLVDEEFLERRGGFYWRSGGTFDVS